MPLGQLPLKNRLPGTTPSTSCSKVGSLESDSEMEVCVQVLVGGVLSGTTPVRDKGSRIGQQEKFGCDLTEAITEASANSTLSTGVASPLRVVPD